MWTLAAAFVLAFAASLGLTPLVRALAPRLGAMDAVQAARKIHARPTPRLGGVAIVVGFFVPLMLVPLWRRDLAFLGGHRFLALSVGGLCIALLGLVDDLRGLTARPKFAVQFAVALGLYLVGHRIDAVSHPFGGAIDIGLWGLPLTLLWVVGIVNAMNLIDGLDGLAAGVAAVMVGLTFAMALHRGDLAMALTMAALGGAVGGFLVFNFPPATIFMGDTGSMFLGFVLATSALDSGQKSSTTVAMLVPVVGLGLPIVDTLGSMLRRARRGRPMFSADREHVHHRLLSAGLGHRQAVLVLYGACVLSALAAFGLTFAGSRSAAWLLAAWAVVAVGLLRLLARGSTAAPVDSTALLARLAAARSADERWAALLDVARGAGACGVTLRLDGPATARTERSWQDRRARGEEQEVLFWSLADEDGRPLGTLALTWPGAEKAPPALVEGVPVAVVDSLTAHVRQPADVLVLRRPGRR
jgi:UDP-GlcNAc:undecaprenyl-phosphate GlcNAc-1-phosphate transferase